MSGVLCIDFGTSSIRAVRRMPSGRLKPLDIGRVTRSKLDDASIRSEIHIDAAKRYIRFGERAILARRDGLVPALYEASPKLWMREPDLLSRPVIKGLELSREDLLVGLLAYSVRAAAEADGISEETLRRIDLRVAHPVWPNEIRSAADVALAEICAKARRIAFQIEWGTVTVNAFLGNVRGAVTALPPKVDVVEPVAAAVELLPSEENVRRICAVVDVGAGTTDVGLFESVVPDVHAQARPKLYPLGNPISVFKAGNLIDEIVLDVLFKRARTASKMDMADVRARIRGIKESLFKQRFIQELGAYVHLDDLKSHPEAKAMARDIRSELDSLVLANEKEISAWMNRPTHSVTKLDVVMAGGGGSIDFLIDIFRKPLQVSGKSLPIEVTVPNVRPDLSTFGASRGRMAVSLGGASIEYDHLVHKPPVLSRIRLGSL